MKSITLNPVLVFRLLIGLLVLGVAGIITGFYFASIELEAQATKTNHAKIDAELVQEEIIRLKQLSTYLEENRSTVDRASEIVAESQQYTYQNQVIDDLNTYAQRTGVQVLGFDFPTTATTPSTGGLKKTAITVTLGGPLPYTNLLNFIKSIEQNLTKIQITNIAITPEGVNSPNVSNPSIGIEVYIR